MPATLKERATQAKAEAQSIQNAASEEGRPLTEDEQTRFDDLVGSAELALKTHAQQVKNGQRLEAVATGLGDDLPDPTLSGATRSDQTFGEAFVNSDVFKQLQSQYPDGIPAKTQVTTGSVRVGRVKNALLTDPKMREPLHVVDLPGLTVLDLFDVITVIDDAPDTIKTFTATFTSAADIVAEGALKPEAAMTWTPATLNQETIAHHMPVTNQALSHNSMLRQIIDRFMINGVRARAQAEIHTDLAAWSALGVQAFDTDLRTTLRRAVTKAQIAGRQLGSGPLAIGISPNDAETLDLEQIANLVLSPGETPNQATGIWRTPLIVSAAFADGFAYVGDMSQVVWYTSGGVNVSVGWVNQQFTENEQTILAETEGVTGVLGAPALIKADLTAL